MIKELYIIDKNKNKIIFKKAGLFKKLSIILNSNIYIEIPIKDLGRNNVFLYKKLKYLYGDDNNAKFFVKKSNYFRDNNKKNYYLTTIYLEVNNKIFHT